MKIFNYLIFILVICVFLSCTTNGHNTTNPGDNDKPPVLYEPKLELLSVQQGPYLLTTDHTGIYFLVRNGDKMIFDDSGIQCMTDFYYSYGSFENYSIDYGDDYYMLSGTIPKSNAVISQKVSLDTNRVKFEVTRTGNFPLNIEWTNFTIQLPVEDHAGKNYKTDQGAGTYSVTAQTYPSMESGITRLETDVNNLDNNIILECSEGIKLEDGRPWGFDVFFVSISLMASDKVIFYLTLPQDTESSDQLVSLRRSQVGYLADSHKYAYLEWSKLDDRPDAAVSLVSRDGTVVKSGTFGQTVESKQYKTARFDFSDIKTAGEYKIVWSGGESEFFPISDTVFDELWQDAIDVYIPWQMCHADVDVGDRAPAHPASHMDDGIRVPSNYSGIDGFLSYECDDTSFDAGDPISITKGGWYDAGDYDQHIAAQAFTIMGLCHAYEEFGLDRDVSSLDMTKQKFTGGVPDGIPDILQQAAWGVYWLLEVQQADGLIYPGVVAQPGLYGAHVAPEEATDNIPGTGDERHVYVDYHSVQQLKGVIALAAASRVFKVYFPDLAAECLAASLKAFEYYEIHGDDDRKLTSFMHNEPIQDGRDSTLIAAAVELYLTTNDMKYLNIIKGLESKIANFAFIWPAPDKTNRMNYIFAPPFLARLYTKIDDASLKGEIKKFCDKVIDFNKMVYYDADWPYEILLSPFFGANGICIYNVYDVYYMSKAFSDVITLDHALPLLYWILGLHPINDFVFITGTAYEGPTHMTSGMLKNYKNAPTHVAGALVPGICAYGDTMLFFDNPNLYRHSEPIINDSAALIFAINAYINQK